MQHDHSLSFTTTVSGMLGGLSRAMSDQAALSNISFPGMIDVATYAVISASVGYCVKVAMDFIHKQILKRRKVK